jgi:hypothetical protein
LNIFKLFYSMAVSLLSRLHVYGERIYTLNDHFTVRDGADERAFQLAEELKCTPALRFATKLNEEIGSYNN